MGYLLLRNVQKRAKNGIFGRFCQFLTWTRQVWVGKAPCHLDTLKYGLLGPQDSQTGPSGLYNGCFLAFQEGQKPVFGSFRACYCPFTVHWHVFIENFEFFFWRARYLPWLISFTFYAKAELSGALLRPKSAVKDKWLCINFEAGNILWENHLVNRHFYHILESNFRPFSGLQHMSEGVQMKGLELYFHLVPVASCDGMRGPRYKASKFMKNSLFVWDLYGTLQRCFYFTEKNCHNSQYKSHTNNIPYKSHTK